MSPLLTGALFLMVFFLAGCSPVSEKPVDTILSSDGKNQQIEISVNHAYSPAIILAKKNIPIELKFKRQEEMESCAKELVIPSQGIDLNLPNHKTTVVRLPASPAGEIPFQCHMNMMRGRIVVQ